MFVPAWPVTAPSPAIRFGFWGLYLRFLGLYLRFSACISDLDGPIRANRFADSRESPDSLELFQGSQTEPLFCESRFGGLKTANRRFEAIRASRSNVMKTGGFSANQFVRFDSRESPRFALRIVEPSKISEFRGKSESFC